MSEADKAKIRKWRKMIEKEFESPYEKKFQEIRKNKKKSKYKDPNFWNEESRKSLSKILESHK